MSLVRLLAAGALVACSKSSETPPTPRIACDALSHDFGPLVEGDRVTHGFHIRNSGHAPLHILRVDGSYSCAAAATGAIAPGEDSDLQVTCRTDERQDPLVDKLRVVSDDPVEPVLELELRAHVERLLAFESRTIDMKVHFGETQLQETRLTGKLAAAARLEVDAVDPPGVEASVVPAESGKAQGLRLSLVGNRVGAASGQVVAKTGLDKPRTLTVLYSAQVFGNLSVDPSRPFIDLNAEGARGVDVRVSSTWRDFRLQAAEVTSGSFVATSRRDESDRGYVVHVDVRAPADGDARGLTGLLRLVSNDPAEPVRDVPLFALGQFRADP